MYKNREHKLIMPEDFFLPFGGTMTGGLTCGAGSLQWVIDEVGEIKPCFFMPKPLFSSGNFLNDNFDCLIHKNRIKKLHVNLEKWEKELLEFSSSIGQICPVMKKYQLYKNKRT